MVRRKPFAAHEANGDFEVLQEAARLFDELDRAASIAGAQAKLAKDQADAAEQSLIRLLQQAGLKSVRLKTGQLYSLVETWYFSLPPKDAVAQRKEAVRWLKRVGAGELFSETIHQSTLSSFLRERLAAKKPVHPAIKSDVRRYVSAPRNTK